MKDDQRLSRVERKRLEQQEDVSPARQQAEETPVESRPRQNEQMERHTSEHPFLDDARPQSESSRPKSKRPNGKRSLPRLAFPKWNRKQNRKTPKQEKRKRDVPARDRSASPSPVNEKPVKRKSRWKGKVALVLLLVLFIGAYAASSPFTFLVMGSDARVGESLSGSRTDSLQLMEFVPRSRTIQNVSIPRDTYTTIPCEPEREGDKITHAFAFGGAACTVGAVEGLTEASVDGQVVITFESFMELIDLIGGVNVTATHSFSEKGFNQTYEYTEGVNYAMDGDMALAYARHRKSDTDGARSNRQTEVMTAVAEKLASPSGWTKVPATYRFMKDEMGLEMNVLQMAAVGLTVIAQPEVNKLQVEGEDAYMNNVYYYQPLEESVNAIRDALDLTLWGTVR